MFGLSFSKVFNAGLAKQPLNWVVVFTSATIWLLAMHVIMQAWGAMRAGPQGAFAGPGQISVGNDATSNFSTFGNLGYNPSGNDIGFFLTGGATGASMWTDAIEGRYAEDGWTGNG